VDTNSIKTPQTILIQKENNSLSNLFAFNQAEEDKDTTTKADILELRAKAIDSYFSERDMPLAGYGAKMVKEADINDIDWRLIPAISVRESTGGKFACKKVKFSAFGWGSCKINFKSYDESIEILAKNLGGNNPKTAHYYDNKTTEQILKKYNPDSIVPGYSKQVIKIMNSIGEENLGEDKVEA
ncbi:MAG: hypothetical protein M3P22_01305, partial [bacterium]|nr:hypothetical protein [bacterium]